MTLRKTLKQIREQLSVIKPDDRITAIKFMAVEKNQETGELFYSGHMLYNIKTRESVTEIYSDNDERRAYEHKEQN
ncbi:hypothetical protein [Providencia sp. PROV266]|uniref:hypothetical protein n=1 Tax=Providencia sp. PROV266 TaxID=2949954 RepID=UPI00234909D2|nr:hypothetical protein [Providencia sp. PROV266]